jgi:signal transduction histidine kinase/PAS domain-containing protein
VSNLKTKAIILTLVMTLVLVSTVLAQSNNPPAQEPLILTDEQGEYPLGLYLEILEDPGGKLTIEDVSSPSFDSQFTPSRVEVPIYGYTDSVYWVRMNLDNQTRQTDEWLLEVDFSNTQYVDLFTPLPDGEGFGVKQTGDLRPLSTRDILYPKIVFDLTLPTHSQQTYYLRFYSGASMSLGLTLQSMDAFWIYASRELMLHWLFYGGLLALLAYHLFLLFILRETIYLYFVLMTASMLATFSGLNGYLGVYLFPSMYLIKTIYFPLIVASLYVSILLFNGEFLELKTRFPKLHWVNIGCIAIWGVLVLMVPFTSYGNIARLMTPWQMASLLVTLIVGIIAWRKGFHPPRFFMIAWFIMAVSLILFLMVRQGIAPSTFFTENSYQLGMGLMVVCWSIALADRINLLKAESEGANRNLRNSEHRLNQILEGMPLGVVVYGKDQKPEFLNKRSVEILGNPGQGIQPDIDAGRTLAQAIEYFSFQVAGTGEKYPLEKLPVYRALQGDPVSADNIEANIGDKHVPLEIWASPVRDDTGNIESAVAVFQDITQRKEAETELAEHRRHLETLVEKRTAELEGANENLQIRFGWLSDVNKVHQTIAGKVSLESAYEELSGKIFQMIDAKLVFILRWENKNGSPEISCWSLKGEYSPDPIIIRSSFQEDSPLRRDIELGETITCLTYQMASYSELLGEYFLENDIQLSILAPMNIGGSVKGVLGVAVTESSQDFIMQNLDLVERMAFDLASLTQGAILLDQALDLAAIGERDRLARDLHDSVTQVLFSATLLSEVLPQIWRRDSELGLQKLDNLKQLTRGALAEMRTLLLELRPSSLVNTPLSDLLTQMAEAVTSRSGLQFKLFIEQIPILPDNVQINFYRIAQEALNNVVKHSQAKQVTMSLSITPLASDSAGRERTEIALMIKDDGVGYSAEKKGPEHLGISIMRERAA